MTTTPTLARRCFQAFLVALTAALLFFPYFQHVAGWPADKPLSGFRTRTGAFPDLTRTSWFDGSFAKTVDLWATEHVGIRGWLVALDRQIDRKSVV